MANAQPEILNVVGEIQEYDAKKLSNGNTKHGVKINGVWYGSFSDSDGADLKHAYDNGIPVSIDYKVAGRYKNVEDVSLMGEPSAETASATPPAPAAPPATSSDALKAIQVSGDKIVDLSEYESQGYLVIYPTDGYVRQISDQHTVRLEVLRVDPRTNKDNKDFYEQSGNWAPKKTLLLKVADAGGLRWDPDRCGFETNQPLFKVFKAVGFTLDASGKPKAVIGHKELDLEVEIGDIKERAKTLTKGYGNNTRAATEEEKQQYIHSETLRLRKHAGSNCETKAYLRAVRAAFQLPAAFTAEEIRKPWLIPRIDFTPDYSDPQVQASLAAQGAAAGAELYPATNYQDMPSQPIADEEPGGGDDDCPF